MFIIIRRRFFQPFFLDVIMGQYGDGRIPADLAFKLELIWDKVPFTEDIFSGTFVADCTGEFRQALCYCILLLLVQSNIEVEGGMLSRDAYSD